MPLMKAKIKNFFGFISRAWSGGIRGKLGIIVALFSFYMFIQMFCGDVSIQKFVANFWHMNTEQEQLAMERTELETLERHINLLQNYSPDYVEELGLKYLNIGDAQVKILKI